MTAPSFFACRAQDAAFTRDFSLSACVQSWPTAIRADDDEDIAFTAQMLADTTVWSVTNRPVTIQATIGSL
jgi:hypothetical protein